MSDELIASLNKQLAEANAESASRKSKLRDLVETKKNLQAELDARTKERDELATKVSQGPQDLQLKLEETQGKYRELLHRGTFEKVAKSLGANETALQDLYSLSGYKPESDEVDEERIKAVVSSTLEARPYFLATKEKPSNGKLAPGPGLARGSTDTIGKFIVTKSELRSIASGPRASAYIDASRNGTLEVVEG